MGHADDVIDLDIPAGADAKRTVDTGIQIDRHSRVRQVGFGRQAGRKTAVVDAEPVGPLPEFRSGIMGVVARGLIGGEQLEHHAARRFRALGGGVDDHAFRRTADAGSGERAFALDLDHAGTTIAIGGVAGFGSVA